MHSSEAQPTPPLLLDEEAAHKALSLGRSKFRQLVAEGEIEVVHIGRRRLVVAESIAAYVARLRAEQVAV